MKSHPCWKANFWLLQEGELYFFRDVGPQVYNALGAGPTSVRVQAALTVLNPFKVHREHMKLGEKVVESYGRSCRNRNCREIFVRNTIYTWA